MLGHSFTLLLQCNYTLSFTYAKCRICWIGGEGESPETVIVIKNNSSCKHAKGTEIKLLMQPAVIFLSLICITLDILSHFFL